MVRLALRRIPPSRIRLHAILRKALSLIFPRRLKHHINPPPQIVENRPSIHFKTRNHLHRPFRVQLTTILHRLQNCRQIVYPTRRESQPSLRWRELARIRHSSHLQRTLRPVQERIEHLRIEILRLLFSKSIMRPHSLRRRSMESR